MFKKIFETPALPYRTPGEWAGIPNGIGLASLYNGYLITPPRLYAEALDFPLALFSKLEATPAGQSTITLLGVTRMIYYPGYALMRWRFDGTTGAFIDRAELAGDIQAGSLTLQSIVQGFDGSLWASYVTGDIREFNPASYALMQTVSAARFGRSSTALPLVDKARDLIVMPTEGALSGITVYKLSTGAVVRAIGTSGAALSLCAEDDKRLYVMDAAYALNLIDYTTGAIISSYRCPQPPAAAYVQTTWDRSLRRLLTFAQVADAADGMGRSSVRGFYPVPLGTHLTAPIPLLPPRRGRQIPVLLRAVGDVGEPISGVAPKLTATGAGSLAGAPGGADNNGDSIAILRCDSPGAALLAATATIDD